MFPLVPLTLKEIIYKIPNLHFPQFLHHFITHFPAFTAYTKLSGENVTQVTNYVAQVMIPRRLEKHEHVARIETDDLVSIKLSLTTLSQFECPALSCLLLNLSILQKHFISVVKKIVKLISRSVTEEDRKVHVKFKA